ncbi:CDP-alcohol phosphatidyltransferase family protein [Flavobacterium branchiophilum]|uniref:CDP-alcohol phosphatidyltransferase n=2 Tax=Flavobacterium branchiophilum TaxID=55197 RepID=A0A2H3KE25_9FLAO|nr:CDP-alcohol phosphatidyltransferase family protein [Flavobacterium branchiophilum]PDS26343.1 CDP-alcohol phosphatidyltransferase [Flavobacterium branchiophilum]CCB70686.1 Putative CDP-alcohol phosphatidyltransferase [Flavobacterium branchiophilum FL-15]
MKTKEQIFNIPNLLSFYRLLAIPLIIWSLTTGQRNLFIILISINLITDVLDGWLARYFQLCTEFGARLDSLADIGTFLLSIWGFLTFEKTFVLAHQTAFVLLFSFYAIPQLVSLIKFRRPTSFHLYSNKFVGYVQGIFIFTFFVFGYHKIYFYFMIVASCLADFEVFVLVLYMPKIKSNAKSLYHILKANQDVNL